MNELRVVLLALVLSPSLVLGGAHVKVQIFEFRLNDQATEMSHVSVVEAENWSGYVNFTYELGPEAFLLNPLEIVDWDKKMSLQVEGARADRTVDFAPGSTTVSTFVEQSSGTVQIVLKAHLSSSSSAGRHEGFSLALSRRTERFSFATPTCNLPVNETKIIVHMPADSIIVNYLPTRNFTLLPQTGGEKSVAWHFTGPSSSPASVYLELSKKRGLGIWGLLLLVLTVLGVVAAGSKLLLSIYEDSITY